MDYEKMIRGAGLSAAQERYMMELTPEQRVIVMDESKYALVTAAAGSGKTRVLVAKYIWLTRVLDHALGRRSKVIYLSFNRKNVNDTQREMTALGVPKVEAEDATSTFHSLALNVIGLGEGAWPRLLEGVKEAWDESWKETWSTRGEVRKINHDAAEVFLKEMESRLDMDRIREAYTKEVRQARGYPNHRYVCYAKDRNGIPGSCRSEVERDIFRFLISENIDFAYEEYEDLVGDRVDFTIYFKRTNDDGKVVVTKMYYEHFAVENAEDFDGDVSEETVERYVRIANLKIEEMTAYFGDVFFYTSSGDDFRAVIRERLSEAEENGTLGTCHRKPEKRGRERVFDPVFEDVITHFREVRGLILETGQRIDETLERIRGLNPIVDEYLEDIFLPIEEVYRDVLATSPPAGPISDFADSLVRAAALLADSALLATMKNVKYDWVLVDEYQDISPSRLALLKALRILNPWMRLLAVGDDWQTINSFAGSDVHLFRRFGTDWKGAVYHPLSETFRFSGRVLEVSTKFARLTGGNSLHAVRYGGTEDPRTDIEIASGVSDPYGRSWQSKFINEKKADFGDDEKYLVLSRFKPQRENDVWMTMHKSKGATVDYVFIKDCCEGAIPCEGNEKNRLPSDRMKDLIRGEDKRESYLEERRLFYVALTRARKKVWLLYFANKEPSPFVEELRRYLKEDKEGEGEFSCGL